MNVFIQNKSTQYGQGPELKLRPDVNISGMALGSQWNSVIL